MVLFADVVDLDPAGVLELAQDHVGFRRGFEKLPKPMICQSMPTFAHEGSGLVMLLLLMVVDLSMKPPVEALRNSMSVGVRYH